MPETAQHPAVSDALASFACGPLGATSAAALKAARDRLAETRALARRDNDAPSQPDDMSRSQGAAAGDLLARAWMLGMTLATASAPAPDMPVLAVVIALGDTLGATEDDMAQAAAIGIESAARILASVDSGEFRARWNVASAIGILGATLAASRLYRLGATQTRHALGVAATQAAGLARNMSHAMGALETGKAAADAIEAALIAKHGFTSAPASIEGRRGFAALMAYRFDAQSIVDGLGSRWVSV